MSVKTIFKVLIGTIFCLLVASVCIELFNVNVTGMQIKQLTTMAANQSAELFTQETYKKSGTGVGATASETTSMPDILAPDGSVYISGRFYNDKASETALWSMLYNSSSNTTFKDLCDLPVGSSMIKTAELPSGNKNVTYSIEYMTPSVKSDKYPFNIGSPKCLKETFIELGQLYAALYDSASVNAASALTITYDDFAAANPTLSSYYSSKVYRKSYASTALTMRNRLYTPVNIGVPYFDPTVVNKIFQWDLAMLLSSGLSTNIHTDEAGNKFVMYQGFRCYIQDSYITNIKYYIIDTADTQGKQKLREMVHMDADNIQKIGEEANNYVVVVGFEYTIPMAYQGVTPLKNIVEYAWNTEVDGNKDNPLYNSVGTDRSGMTGTGTYSYATSDMTNAVTGVNGLLDSTGEIYYILVR